MLLMIVEASGSECELDHFKELKIFKIIRMHNKAIFYHLIIALMTPLLYIKC